MKTTDTLSVSALAELTKLDRRTIRTRLAAIAPTSGRYRLADVLPALCTVEESREGTESESRRLLNDSRRKLTEIQLEVLRKERIPIEDVKEINARAFESIAGILKASDGRMMTQATIGDMLAELRGVGEALIKRE